MTKTQAKAQLKKLIDKLRTLNDEFRDIQEELNVLNYEIEETADSIEPYGDNAELTYPQQERQAWFEELYTLVDDIVNIDIEETIEALAGYIEY